LPIGEPGGAPALLSHAADHLPDLPVAGIKPVPELRPEDDAIGNGEDPVGLLFDAAPVVGVSVEDLGAFKLR
jgi:hypothetical protein